MGCEELLVLEIYPVTAMGSAVRTATKEIKEVSALDETSEQHNAIAVSILRIHVANIPARKHSFSIPKHVGRPSWNSFASDDDLERCHVVLTQERQRAVAYDGPVTRQDS